MILNFGRAELEGPLLIPSISSFETQYSGKDAIILQTILSEPISLVSTFDISADQKMKSAAQEYQAAGGILFLDSGGYEYSRSERYFPVGWDGIESFKSLLWSRDRYLESAKSIGPDLVASFDEFYNHNESVKEYTEKLITFFADHQEIFGSALVPVVHLQDRKGERRIPIEDGTTIVSEISNALSPGFIAIPERELGLGLIERTHNCRRLVRALDACKKGTKLHVLGCGNPLTFAFLASAGVAMADGLEWCRTQYGPNFHLHHFQQFDVLPNDASPPSDTAAYLLETQQAGNARILIRNLAVQQSFVEAVREALRRGSLREFLLENFPLKAEALNAIGE